MAASAAPVIIFTLLWFVVGAVLPWFVPRSGDNRGVVQTMLVTTAICCYLFWLCAYMMQMNPLIGPQLENVTLNAMRHYW